MCVHGTRVKGGVPSSGVQTDSAEPRVLELIGHYRMAHPPTHPTTQPPTHPPTHSPCRVGRSDVAAWAFGYRRGIIVHGMSVVHAALMVALRRTVRPRGAGGRVHLDVAFVRPIFRSAALELALSGTAAVGSLDFSVTEEGSSKELVVGALRMSPP